MSSQHAMNVWVRFWKVTESWECGWILIVWSQYHEVWDGAHLRPCDADWDHSAGEWREATLLVLSPPGSGANSIKLQQRPAETPAEARNCSKLLTEFSADWLQFLSAGGAIIAWHFHLDSFKNPRPARPWAERCGNNNREDGQGGKWE